MGEKFGDLNIDLDTIIMPVIYADGDPANFDSINDVYVFFSANYDDALSYEWQVGNNTTSQTTKEFGLYFTDTMTINVRLIMTSTPNTKCFPNDDGIDTIDRVLSIRNVQPHPMWGTYSGHTTDNPNVDFTIEIDTLTRYSSQQSLFLCQEVIKNLPNGKVNPVAFSRVLGSASYSFIGLGDVPPPYNDIIYVGQPNTSIFAQSSRGVYDPKTGEIRITYFTKDILSSTQLSGSFTEHTFIGKKL